MKPNAGTKTLTLFKTPLAACRDHGIMLSPVDLPAAYGAHAVSSQDGLR